METKYISSTNMGQSHTWIHVPYLPVHLVECMTFKPAQVLTVIVEVVLGRSDQQMALGHFQLDMETKYISSTNMGQSHTWIHVALKP